MPLGLDKLKELLREDPPLVEDLSERELNNPEGTGYDLRIANLWRPTRTEGSFIGVKERDTPRYEEVPTIEWNGMTGWRLHHQGFWLAETIETVNMPLWLAGRLSARTTTFTCGLFFAFGPVQPGYMGTLRFGLRNVDYANTFLEVGARIVHIQFDPIFGEAEQYRGQWQGGRVFTTSKEEQV